MIMTEQENPDWNSVNVWEMQVKLGGFGHFRNAIEQTGSRARLPKDIWSRDPEEIEALFDRHKASVGDLKDDIKSIAKILYRLVTGTEMEGNLHKL